MLSGSFSELVDVGDERYLVQQVDQGGDEYIHMSRPENSLYVEELAELYDEYEY